MDRRKFADHCYHQQFIGSSSSASCSKWVENHAWFFQEWKIERDVRTVAREIPLGFSHEETHHDGIAHSVVNEVMPRDRPWRLDIDCQEEAGPQHLFIGNDSAELALSVESRSFVNQLNDQVRKRLKRISNVAEKWRNNL